MVKKVVVRTLFISFVLLVVGLLGTFIWAISKPGVESAWTPEILGEGKIAALSQGGTYYEVAGPDTGEVVLFLHGSIVPNVAFDNNFTELADEFRVIRFDFYGRGYSSRPATNFTIDFYMTQINELLAYLNVDQPIHIVGLSMGGAISVIYNQRFPEKVRSVTLLDPVTPTSFENDTTSFPQRLHKRVKKIRKRFSDDEETVVKDLMDKAADQFAYRGVGRSIFSAVKHLKRSDLVTPYEALEKEKKPALLIWGEKDDVIPATEADVVKSLVPHIEYHLIKDAGHVPHYEFPNIVNPILRQFFQKN